MQLQCSTVQGITATVRANWTVQLRGISKGENTPLPYLGHPEEGPLHLTAGKYSYVGPVMCYMSQFFFWTKL